jgi:tetratricopeptide (TPR) repeat protein
MVALGSDARAQFDRSDRMIPTHSYFATIATYYNAGEYRRALDQFQSEWRGAIKTAQSRWIDSICYHTMMGECYYQMGELDKALEQYTAALRLYISFPDWLVRLVLPSAIRPAMTRQQVPWGPSTRRAQLGQYPSTVLMSQGRVNNNAVIQQGGTVQQAVAFPIQAQEILRCTALAIRRRAELMGPLCQYDPLTTELVTVLSGNPGLPNHWSQAWIDVEYGLAMVSGGRLTEGMATLNRGILAAGQFDHQLTATALFALGRLHLNSGKFEEALHLFHEASISAVYYPDYGLVEESIRYGMIAHLAANRKGPYPPLLTAAQWAKREDVRQMSASVLVCHAEHLGILGQTGPAATLLDEAQAMIGRRDMGAGSLGARLSYVRAVLAFQQRRTAQGDEALAAAMTYMRHGSLWLYQTRQVDRCFLSGQITTRGPITARAAMELYGELLRDPQAIDWVVRPMESLAVLMVPHRESWEHWFLVALERKEHETALEIADRARRHRFFSSLAYGGRLESLRWILEAPERDLPQVALLERQNLLAQYPAYQQLSQQVRKLRGELEAMPLVVEDQAAAQKQRDAFQQLGTLSVQQEAILREMALRREPAEAVFPPVRSIKEIQAGLPDGQVLLAFFQARGELYGFLLNRERYAYWRVKSSANLVRGITTLLREMGNYEGNRELTLKELADTSWKQTAKQVLDGLLEGSDADFSTKFPELVIVPDGVLWYLPFDALQVKVSEQLRPLISRFRIRYVPTASLAVPSSSLSSTNATTAVVLGKLHPRDDGAVAQAAFKELTEVLPRSVAIAKSPLPAPSALYASVMRRLIVLDDLNPAEQEVYGWAPIQLDRGKPGNLLTDWFVLPFGGPEVVILPGFHTAAESSLKRAPGNEPGTEIFLNACALMSTGAKTLLLSRWRTGGKLNQLVVREFAQELPHTSPADAWQRAVLVAVDTRLELDAEPRVQRVVEENPPRAVHPFFWAGYLLIDRGVADPSTPEDPADKPVLKLKPGAGADKPAEGGDKPVLRLKLGEDKPAEPAKPGVENQPEEPGMQVDGTKRGAGKKAAAPRPDAKKRPTKRK